MKRINCDNSLARGKVEAAPKIVCKHLFYLIRIVTKVVNGFEKWVTKSLEITAFDSSL